LKPTKQLKEGAAPRLDGNGQKATYLAVLGFDVIIINGPRDPISRPLPW